MQAHQDLDRRQKNSVRDLLFYRSEVVFIETQCSTIMAIGCVFLMYDRDPEDLTGKYNAGSFRVSFDDGAPAKRSEYCADY